jgi:DNA-binding NarL/FixJ family response regulator
MNIRVLLADDQPTIRQGLRLRLGLETDIDVVGEASDGNDAVALATHLRPDVVIMDVTMPILDGIDATRELRRHVPDSAVVILSLQDDATTRSRARLAGAAAFVAKHDADHSLIVAIRDAAIGRADPAIHEKGPSP